MRPDLDDPHRAAPAAGEQQGSLPLARAIGTRNLIIIIVTMPLVFIFVVLGVIAIAGDPGKREARLAEPALAPLEQPAAYRGAVAPLQTTLPQSAAPLVISKGESIGAMALDGDRLAVRIEGDLGGEIVIYDLATGAQLQKIPVRNGAPDEGGL
ncbi:MAG: hypothetical protein RIE56_09345 [Amphiplicatus sp.]